MLSIQLFLGLPVLRLPSTVPCIVACQQHSSPAVKWTHALVLTYILNLSCVSYPIYTLEGYTMRGGELTLHRWAYELQRVTGQGGEHHGKPTAKCPDRDDPPRYGVCRLWSGLQRCGNGQTSLPKTRITRRLQMIEGNTYYNGHSYDAPL